MNCSEYHLTYLKIIVMIIAGVCQALTMCRHLSKCFTWIKSSQQLSEVGIIFLPVYSEEATEFGNLPKVALLENGRAGT